MLKDDALIAEVGIDTAENEPQKVSEKRMVQRTPLVIGEGLMSQKFMEMLAKQCLSSAPGGLEHKKEVHSELRRSYN